MKKHYRILAAIAALAIIVQLPSGCSEEIDPPVASFSFTPDVANTKEPVTFNAGESDPGSCDGCAITKYYWDWENDGIWDLITEESTVTHQYLTAKVYNVALKVRNTQGYTSKENAVKNVEVQEGSANQPPSQPVAISPENGSQAVATSIQLQWTVTDPENDPLLYDIYLDTESPPALAKSNHEGSSYDTPILEQNTTYFWKIIAKDDQGGQTEGQLWSFTTGGTGPGANRPPNPPTSPYPEHMSQNRPLNQILQWEASDPNGDALRFDVYFGTSEEPTLRGENITSTSHNPLNDLLEPNTTYYWQIKAKDNDTSTMSDLWQFQTGSSVPDCPSEFTDIRNNRTYKTVQIGMQCWMAESLNYGTMLSGQVSSDNGQPEKYCYNNNSTNCSEYGALYQWDELMGYSDAPEISGLCPDGWHIPSEEEWHRLVDYLGGNFVAGKKMKTGGTSGFDALMSGTREPTGSFGQLELKGYYWASSSKDDNKALQIHLDSSLDGVYYNYNNKSTANAVRCIKN